MPAFGGGVGAGWWSGVGSGEARAVGFVRRGAHDARDVRVGLGLTTEVGHGDAGSERRHLGEGGRPSGLIDATGLVGPLDELQHFPVSAGDDQGLFRPAQLHQVVLIVRILGVLGRVGLQAGLFPPELNLGSGDTQFMLQMHSPQS